MSDIMTYIMNDGVFEDDPKGALHDQGEWSPEIAEALAAEQGISLSPEHWEVLHFLRSFVRINGEIPSAHILVKSLDGQFASAGGRRYLYQLFPGGPMLQGCLIAGLDIPAHARNPSFGTMQ